MFQGKQQILKSAHSEALFHSLCLWWQSETSALQRTSRVLEETLQTHHFSLWDIRSQTRGVLIWSNDREINYN